MDAFLQFIKDQKILLIVIGVAIVLLILVSIFGKVKAKKDEEKEKSTDNKEDNSAEEQTATVQAEQEADSVAATEEAVEEPAQEEAVVEEAPAEIVEEQPVAVAQEEVVVEQEDIVVEEQVAEEQEEKSTLPGTVEVYKGKNDFYFSFRASNNILIGRSQGYTTKEACKRGVMAVMTAAEVADIRDSVKADDEKTYKPAFGKAVFEIYMDKEGKYRWRLYAKNQQNILASKGYASKAGAKRAVQSLKKIAANYVLEDMTKAKK